MMAKQSFYSVLGSRNFVVNPTFQLYAAKRALETGGAAQDVLGPQQNAWLAGVLSQSPAAWKVVGNSVMMTPTMVDFTNPLIAASLPPGFPDELRTAINLNNEDFSGFPNYRDQLLDSLFSVVPGEVVLVSGDIHSAFVSDHRNGVYEFTPPAVSSGTFGELAIRLAQTDPILSQIPGVVDLLEQFLGQFFQVSSTSQQYSRTDIAYAETFTHGYGVFEVAEDALTVTYHEIPSSETGTDHTGDPAALDALFTATTFRVQGGELVPVP
jgi:alkaline phosphatase D